MPIDRIREVLYNVEQFRADALKLPQIQTKSSQSFATASLSAKTDGGPVYGAGAKSAGSIGS